MYELNCHKCGSPFPCAAQNGRYCQACRPEANREIARASYRKRNPPPEPFDAPEGNLAYLADVPEWVRMAAFESLVEAGELSEEEIPLAFAAALEPGSLSTRLDTAA